jgi:Protein of unknown function (DUF2934)
MIASTHDIQVRSYLIWEKEGRPQGCDWDHWLKAEAELLREQVKPKKATSSASPRVRKSKKSKSRAPKKPATKKT